MADIIKFPTTTEKEYVDGTIVAKEAARQMKVTEDFLNYRLNFKDWDEYNLAERDVEIVALFGEHMMLAPVVTARLNAKLATILCKIKCFDPLDEI